MNTEDYLQNGELGHPGQRVGLEFRCGRSFPATLYQQILQTLGHAFAHTRCVVHIGNDLEQLIRLAEALQNLGKAQQSCGGWDSLQGASAGQGSR